MKDKIIQQQKTMTLFNDSKIGKMKGSNKAAKTQGNKIAQLLKQGDRIEAAKELKSITILDLSNNKLAEKEVGILAEMLHKHHRLTTLNLSGNNIGDMGAEILAEMLYKNHHLTTLNLSGNNIGDKGGEILAIKLNANHTLTTLNLSNNKIKNWGAEMLAEILVSNSTLKHLDLTNNEIADKGMQRLINAIEDHRSLTSLNIGKNILSSETVKMLGDKLKTNNLRVKSLSFEENKIDLDHKVLSEFFTKLNSNTRLTSLNFKGNKVKPEDVKEFINLLKNNTTLTDLKLMPNNIEANKPTENKSEIENLIKKTNVLSISESSPSFKHVNMVANLPIEDTNAGSEEKDGKEKDIEELVAQETNQTNKTIVLEENIPTAKVPLKYKINAIESDIDNFEKLLISEENLKNFINQLKIVLKDSSISNDDDVYSLLLGAAIALKRVPVVEKILKEDHGNILTSPDATGYSPISKTLYAGNETILKVIKEYINKYIKTDSTRKTECEEGDKANILTIMKFPQIENLTTDTYKELLEPLYNDITPFIELLGSFEMEG